jgi:hypothetical protein
MLYEAGVYVVCIYRGVNERCLPVDACLAALVGCVVVWFSLDSVLEMHLHLMGKYLLSVCGRGVIYLCDVVSVWNLCVCE